MRVLITGGGGFIGAWIARRLYAMGWQIRVLDTQNESLIFRTITGECLIDWCIGDVSDPAVVNDACAGCDAVIHLAALLTPACMLDPIRGAHVNLIGTLNVFEAARTHQIQKILYMSSAGVFGHDDGVNPKPDTHYGAFKLAGEGCARAYWLDHGVASIGFRPLIVYGPGRESGLTAGPTLACKAAIDATPYMIGFTGESDFVFVDDVAMGFQAAITTELEDARVYNITGELCNVKKIVKIICDQVPGADIGVEGPKVPVSAHIEQGLLRQQFTEVSLTSIDNGLTQTIEFYQQLRAI